MVVCTHVSMGGNMKHEQVKDGEQTRNGGEKAVGGCQAGRYNSPTQSSGWQQQFRSCNVSSSIRVYLCSLQVHITCKLIYYIIQIYYKM